MKQRIVISMHGGLIQDIFVENEQHLDVVVLEGVKYASDDPCREEITVEAGPDKGEVVYQHLETSEAGVGRIHNAFDAARRYDDRS